MPRLVPAFALLLAAVPALASSDEAWQEFAEEVGRKCLEAAAPALEQAKAADATVSYVCVMDKQTRAVELGSELPAETLGVTIP